VKRLLCALAGFSLACGAAPAASSLRAHFESVYGRSVDGVEADWLAMIATQ
jgi:hypothetical protein